MNYLYSNPVQWIALAVIVAMSGCAGMGNGRSRSTNHGMYISLNREDSKYSDSSRPGLESGASEKQTSRPVASVRTVAFDEDDKAKSKRGTLRSANASESDAPRLNLEAETDSSHTSLAISTSSAGSALSLAEIEQIALANNPAILASNASQNVAAGLRRQVGTLPNPIVGYSANQIADAGTDQHTAFIQQEFVRGNKLALNRQVLQHTERAQQWETETQRYRVLTDVRMRFYEALAAQWQLDATNEFAKVARRGVDVAEQRKEAGEGTTIEVLQSQTLLSEINLAREQSTAAYRGAWADLAAIAGMDSAHPSQLAAEFQTPTNAPAWDNAFAEITAQSPELAAARAVVCEKQANLKRQQIQMTPNITGQLGAGFDRATDSGLINLQISAPIPVRNLNSGNIAAAHAEYTRAVENVNRIELGIKSRLARAAQEYDSSFAAVNKYEQEIIPQAKKTLELSEDGYRAGELDFLQVLVVRRSYYDATIRLITAQGHLAQANAKIDGLLLVGGLDAPQDYTSGDGLRGQSFGGQ